MYRKSPADVGHEAGLDNRFILRPCVLGVKATSHSTVTIEVGGETRTFAEGSGISFENVGGSVD